MDKLLTDALENLLAKCSTPNVIRAAERDSNISELWNLLDQSGFANALLPESQGGAGLNLHAAYPLLELCGKYALPVPLAETMLARAALQQSGITPPEGPITMAWTQDAAPISVHYGKVAEWVLLQSPSGTQLLPISLATVGTALFPLDAQLSWPAHCWDTHTPIEGIPNLQILLACTTTAQLVGLALTVFNYTLKYANEREQFGRKIGRFQAVQQQISVMAEHVFAARMASTIACLSANWQPDPARVAIAKAYVSETVHDLAQIAHAIHGAIGITEEYDLQLYTRRLYQGRLTAGTESYWYQQAGEALIEQGGSTLDRIRSLTELNPTNIPLYDHSTEAA